MRIGLRKYPLKPADPYSFRRRAGEVIQLVSDIEVDVLSMVTGPAGKTVKAVYTGLKGVGCGLGEGLASGDVKNKNTERYGIRSERRRQG